MRRNKNRGYQQLRVWQDAIELYRLTRKTFRSVPFELKRTASQEIASADSVHRNIAEGYCRKSIKEYLRFLFIALASLGEYVSGLAAYRAADDLSEEEFERLDSLAFKLENGLLKLAQSLQRKSDDGDWEESLVVQEQNDLHGEQYSKTPPLRYSETRHAQ